MEDKDHLAVADAGGVQGHTPGPWEQCAPLVGGVVESTYRTISAGNGNLSDAAPLEGFGITGFISEEDARLMAASPKLLAALRDMLSGWIYIRHSHGDLYGVGWDRAQKKAEKAIAAATKATP